MELRVLGPVEARVEGAPVPIGRRRERLLLALLALDAGREVAADRLITLIWPDRVPEDPRRALQVSASRLRQVLHAAEPAAAPVLVGSRGAYRLEVAPDQVDAHRFQRLTQRAQSVTDPRLRRELLREALDLWRGDALHGVTDEASRIALAAPLEASRVAALEQRIAADLALGVGSGLVGELRELTAAHPYSERLAAAMMSALWQAGRSAEALESFRGYRDRVVADLGLDPGQELVDLERQILTGAEPGWGRDEPAEPAALQRAPYQVPPDVPLLVGRRALIEEVVALLGAEPTTRPRVLNLHGGAGVGKSVLAVRIAHRLAAAHPDGVLFLSLRAGLGRPIEARAALDTLLRSLGVPADSIPADLHERAARWRTETAGRRLLVVLDDAADVAQVRPLLPASASCSVLVTARRPLVGLEVVTSRQVPPLDPDQARALLSRLAGPGAVDPADPRVAEAVSDIVATCGGMPLALRIVGSRLAEAGGAQVEEIAGALADSSERLDWLVAGDLAVRATLELAHADAAPAARTMFDRLAPLEGDTLSAWAAAALADLPERQADQALQGLAELGLLVVVPTAVGRRYRMHSLVRSFAQERWISVPEGSRAAALARLVRTAAHLAGRADVRLGHGIALAEGLQHAGAVATELTERQITRAPRDWLDVEHEFLIDLVRTAPAGVAETAAALAVRLIGYLLLASHRERHLDLVETAVAIVPPGSHGLASRLRQAQFSALAQADRPVSELIAVARVGALEAEGSGDSRLFVGALLQVGYAAHRSAELDEARTAYERAQRLGEQIGDAARVHNVRAALGEVLDDLGHTGEALALLTVPAPEQAGARSRALSLDVLANVAVNAGQVEIAERAVDEMGQILDVLDDQVGQVYLACDRARLRVLQGRLDEAVALLDDAAEAFTALQDVEGLTRVDRARAEHLVSSGERQAATAALHTALARSSGLGHPLERRRTERHAVRLGLSLIEPLPPSVRR